jgi:glycosyltransferase involved in cell wall biosynthesis
VENNHLVSIIVPVYNGERYLGEAIENIVSQAYRPIEIIVVDDGSTDATKTVAKRYENKIMYVYQNNRGPAAARNRGLRMASGDIMGFLDADDLWSENKLVLQLARLADDPALEIVLGISQPMRLRQGAGGVSKFEKWYDPFCALLVGAGVFRKSVFDKVGFFDEALYYGEDTDWFMRAREIGVSMIILPEVTLFYRRHELNMTLDSATTDRYFIKALKKSLDRRRQAGAGLVAPFPKLSIPENETHTPASPEAEIQDREKK